MLVPSLLGNFAPHHNTQASPGQALFGNGNALTRGERSTFSSFCCLDTDTVHFMIECEKIKEITIHNH